jgi:hypothetical protein
VVATMAIGPQQAIAEFTGQACDVEHLAIATGLGVIDGRDVAAEFVGRDLALGDSKHQVLRMRNRPLKGHMASVDAPLVCCKIDR